MGLWHKLISMVSGSKPEVTPTYLKIVAIRGELVPGFLAVDLGEFETATDKPTPTIG